MDDFKKPDYHHGNVKNELVATAMLLLEEEGIEKISLRRLAREIGITPAAVYNHFEHKQQLMTAIKAKAFEKYVNFIEVHFKTQPEPELNLVEICRIYFNFSRQHPTLFDVMYKQKAPPDFFNTRRIPAYQDSRGRLFHALAEVYDKYQIPFTEESLSKSVLLMWAQLHGLIVLHESGSLALMIGEENVPEKGSPEEFVIIDKLIEQMTQNYYRTLKNLRNAFPQKTS